MLLTCCIIYLDFSDTVTCNTQKLGRRLGLATNFLTTFCHLSNFWRTFFTTYTFGSNVNFLYKFQLLLAKLELKIKDIQHYCWSKVILSRPPSYPTGHACDKAARGVMGSRLQVKKRDDWR